MKSPTPIDWSIGTKDQHGGLFPLELSVDAYVLADHNAAGLSIGDFAVLFEPTAVTYFMVAPQWKRVSRAYFRTVQHDLTVTKRLFTNVRRSSHTLLSVAQRIANQPLKKCTRKQLMDWYDKYIVALRRVYYYGLVTTLLDFNDDLYVTDVLMQIIRNHHIPPEAQGTVFATLTTPTKRSHDRDAQEHIDAIIAIILASEKIFQYSVEHQHVVTEEMLSRFRQLRREVRTFHKRFSWLGYGFEGPAMTTSDVRLMLQERLQHLEFPFQGVIERQRMVASEQRAMIRRYQFTPVEQQWFSIGRDLAFSKSYRRLHQSHSYALMEPFFIEIARRSGTTVQLWKMLTLREVRAVLVDGAPLPVDLVDRRTYCVYGRNNKNTFLYTGGQARAMVDPILQRAGEGTPVVFHGQVAYPGTVEGIARVIRTPSDLHNIPQHSIIISPSLNPRMQVSMHRAGAIVTDAGGLTCHAAVVSRELKIPCIVGAKNASTHIRTGNRVRIDALRGTVTIVAQ